MHELGQDMASSEQFVELLTRHQSQVFGLILAMVQRMDDAEDVMQETTAALWRDFARFEPGTDFVAWARTTARHRALQHLAARRRKPAALSVEYLAELAERQTDESEYVAARRAALHECAKKLRPQDVELLDLCYSRGAVIQQVAEQIGRPLGSVYDSLYRIRRTLHECIRRALAEEGSA